MIRAPACVLGALLLLAGCATVESGLSEGAEDAESRAEARTELALGYLKRDELKTARDELEQALEIDPSNTRANYVMAMLQTQLGDPDKAERHYRRSLKSDPGNAVAAHDYGLFLCKEGRVEAAMQQFENALNNPLYRRKTLTNLRAGECLVNMLTDRRGAERYFRAALNANPRLGPALYHMADIAYARGEYLAARGYIERYFATAPDTPASLLLAVKIESKLGAGDVAAKYAARLRKKFASSDEARMLKVYQ